MIVLAIMGIVLAVLLAKYLGFQPLQDIKITTILLSTGGALLIALLWRMQQDRTTTYDALDMLMDTDGKASLEAHITIIMAFVAIWWIVRETLEGKDVSERMIDVLMIFVIYRGAKKVIDAYVKKPIGSPGVQEIDQQVVVTPRPPSVPKPRDVRQPRAAKMAPAPAVKTATGKTLPTVKA